MGMNKINFFIGELYKNKPVCQYEISVFKDLGVTESPLNLYLQWYAILPQSLFLFPHGFQFQDSQSKYQYTPASLNCLYGSNG